MQYGDIPRKLYAVPNKQTKPKKIIGDSLFVWYWPNQHGKHAMLDMPLWSCQLQQHILADPVNSF